MDYIKLSYDNLALAALLVLLNAGLSLYFQLGLGKKLLIASLRMVTQLFLLGLFLTVLFKASSPLFTLLAALAMLGFAGREAYARQSRRLAGWWSFGIGTGSMMIAAISVTIIGLTTQVSPDPWYAPRYALPLLGMILGNTMNGISLGLDNLTSLTIREKSSIEARLALGADRLTALNQILRTALRTSLMPTINSMSAIGLVSIPGMMTGQILAGADPIEATKYQMMIMFMIAGSNGLGSVTAVISGALRLTDSRHRLRLERITESRKKK